MDDKIIKSNEDNSKKSKLKKANEVVTKEEIFKKLKMIIPMIIFSQKIVLNNFHISIYNLVYNLYANQ